MVPISSSKAGEFPDWVVPTTLTILDDADVQSGELAVLVRANCTLARFICTPTSRALRVVRVKVGSGDAVLAVSGAQKVTAVADEASEKKVTFPLSERVEIDVRHVLLAEKVFGCCVAAQCVQHNRSTHMCQKACVSPLCSQLPAPDKRLTRTRHCLQAAL